MCLGVFDIFIIYYRKMNIFIMKFYLVYKILYKYRKLIILINNFVGFIYIFFFISSFNKEDFLTFGYFLCKRK